MSKYKYYFRKPRSEIAKDIFSALLIGGVVAISATSPNFVSTLFKEIGKNKKYEKKKFDNVFYRLRKSGYLNIEKENNQIYIHLTEAGKKKAGWLQIDDLKIEKPKKWDKKWRIVIFDIAQLKKIYREAFRGKLKELGFHPLQKSVWIHPFDCKAEIDLLQDFFGLSEKEMGFIVAESIGQENNFKNLFKLI